MFTLDELVDVFQLERVSKSGAKFDMDKSKWFNHQFLMRSNAQELKAMIEDQLLPIHTQKGEEYLIQVIDLLKEKVTFPSELLSMGQYFFDLPSSYDEKVQRKKWNEEV